MPARASQSLLAYLVLAAGVRHRREKLAGVLWPDYEEASAKKLLRQALWQVRKSIGRQYVLADRITVGFNPEAEYELDIDVLKREDDWEAASDKVVRSISHYSGELLPGFYDEWVSLERERLRALFDLRMQLLLNRLLDDRRWQDAVLCSESWIARGDVPEAAYRGLMIAHRGLNEPARVSEAYQRCADDLRRELGVDPSQETQRLCERLLRAEEPLLEPLSLPRHNLPQPLTSFIGRRQELALIREQLAGDSCRLITLTGPGGVGKTRLALQAARGQLQSFAQGVFFVSLAPVTEDKAIAPAIADALSFTFEGEGDPKSQLLDYLREKEVLLALDNLEHLPKGTMLLAAILECAPGVKILATSRQGLGLYGEWVFSVGGMPYPAEIEAEQPEGFSAIQLFLDRARMASPGFKPSGDDRRAIVRICQLVEGIPLAIELASAWTPSLSCQEIAEAIESNLDVLATTRRDVPARQRSLRASFNYTWSMLPKREKRILCQLSILRGGFPKELAKAVAEATLTDLSSLLDKALLRRNDAGYFEIHPLLWRFVREELRDRPAERLAAKDMLTDYYVRFLTDLSRDIRGPGHDAAMSQVSGEIENIRIAVSWMGEQVNLGATGEVVDVLRAFYDLHGWYEEAEQAFGETVEKLGKALPSPGAFDRQGASIYVKALASQAWFCHRLHRGEEAQSLGEEALALAHEFGARDVEADALDTLGVIALRKGEYAKAAGLFQESLEIWRELGSSWWQGAELSCLAHVARSEGRLQDARQHSQEALSKFRESGNQWGIIGALSAQGAIARELGEHDEAERCYQDSLNLSREMRYQGGIARSSLGLGRTAFQDGESDKAWEHAHTSLKMYTELGKRVEIPSVLTLIGNLHLAQGEQGAALERFLEALGIAADVELDPEILRALVGVARLLVSEGKHSQAGQLLDYVMAHPAMKSSDRAAASELLSSLGTVSPQADAGPQLKISKSMAPREVAEIILSARL